MPQGTERGSVTVGVDLSSQPKDTAVCIIGWRQGTAEVHALSCGHLAGQVLDDDALVAVMEDADKVAINAPFGWPEPFIRAISARPGDWPLTPGESRAPLEHRTTDLLVRDKTGKTPRSVTTDWIAHCAMRCGAILAAIGSARDGSSLAVEAYADVALRCWLPALFAGDLQSYKAKNSFETRRRRETLLTALLDELGDALIITEQQRVNIAYSDDCLEALVCALVARAAAKQLTMLPETPEQQALALVEGWIHMPRPSSLRQLTLP